MHFRGLGGGRRRNFLPTFFCSLGQGKQCAFLLGEGEGGNKEGAMRGKRGSLALFLSLFCAYISGAGGGDKTKMMGFCKFRDNSMELHGHAIKLFFKK